MVYQLTQISDADFRRLAGLLTGRFGIKLPPEKRIMLQARLQRRLRQLHFDSFEAYCRFVFDPANTEAELPEIAECISTNKTDFFREIRHFELLGSFVLPDLCSRASFASNPILNCWSAGCSSGQEAWSLAMTLEDYREHACPRMDYSILGTDISVKVLEAAREATYPFRQSACIPVPCLKKYVLRSKDKENPRIRIDRRLRSKAVFNYGNLMDFAYHFDVKFGIVFIRNTLIYFDRENQIRILEQVLNQMEPGGYLFVGHSESLINLGLPLSHVRASLYQKS